MAGKFLDPLQLEYIDGRKWRLIRDFDYHLGTPEGAEYIRVPEEFITDFASVPRFLWRVLPPTGEYGKAAVIHDYLYQYRYVVSWPSPTSKVLRLVDRAEADRTFLEGMEVLGVGRFTRWTMYAGVRAGGWQTWNGYRAKEVK